MCGSQRNPFEADSGASLSITISDPDHSVEEERFQSSDAGHAQAVGRGPI